jgi:hypothetical protein
LGFGRLGVGIHEAVEVQVVGYIDNTHATLPRLFDELIVAERLADHFTDPPIEASGLAPTGATD